MNNLKIVSIGGGTGQSMLLSGLREYTSEITAIVTVTDSGSSTGVIRKEFDLLAPGDIRNCLVSLSNCPQLLKDLFAYRFETQNEKSNYANMNFGNLFIAAMSQITGSFDSAIEEVSKILNIQGQVLPATLSNTHIHAKTDKGIIKGEANIARSYTKKKNIQSIFLEDKKALANEKAVQAILKADLIIIGPGGLYTSVLVNLLPKGMREALLCTSAKIIYVPNIATQQGVTDSYDMYKHYSEINKYLKKIDYSILKKFFEDKKIRSLLTKFKDTGMISSTKNLSWESFQETLKSFLKYQSRIDYCLINNLPPPKNIIERYKKAGADYIKIDSKQIEKVENNGTESIVLNLIEKKFGRKLQSHKIDYIRHDPKKLTKAIMSIGNSKLKGVILVAGKGTRMKPFSINSSKELLPFLGRPLIAQHVNDFIKNGIYEVVLICNKDNINEIKEFFTKDYLENLKTKPKYKEIVDRIKFEFAIQKEQKGPADALYQAKEYLKNSKFILKYGDSLSEFDQIKQILSVYYKNPEVQTIITLRKVINPSEYGIAKFKEVKIKQDNQTKTVQRVVDIIEKPKINIPSEYANVGLSIIDFNYFEQGLKKIGLRVIPPASYVLKAGGEAAHWFISGERVDVGRVWNILEANKMLLKRFNYKNSLKKSKADPKNISPKAKIGEYVFLGKNAKIGAGTVINGYSSIEGNIGKNCKITNSVIMEGSILKENCIIQHSVIGKNCFIDKGFETKCQNKDVKELDIYVKDKYVSCKKNKLGVFLADNVKIKNSKNQKIKSEPGKMVFPNKTIYQDITQDYLIQAILFDADNTLYQTKKIAKLCDQNAFDYFAWILSGKKQNKKLIEILTYDFNQIVSKVKNSQEVEKRSRKYSYKLLLLHHEKQLFKVHKKLTKKNLTNEDLNKYVEKAYSIFKQTIKENLEIMPNLRKFLGNLENYKLAIFTEDEKELNHLKLSNLRIESLFDVIITANEIGLMKPSQEYFNQVFKSLDVSPQECVVIGDNFEKDLKIPKDLGAITVLMSNYQEQKNHKFKQEVDFYINDFSEMEEIIKKL